MSTDSCLSKHPSSHHYHRQQQQPYFYTSSVYYPANSYHYGLADGGHVRRSSTNTTRSSSPVEGVRQAAKNSASKRYVCQVCNKGFTRPSSLTTHTYSHTGEVK